MPTFSFYDTLLFDYLVSLFADWLVAVLFKHLRIFIGRREMVTARCCQRAQVATNQRYTNLIFGKGSYDNMVYSKLKAVLVKMLQVLVGSIIEKTVAGVVCVTEKRQYTNSSKNWYIGVFSFYVALIWHGLNYLIKASGHDFAGYNC